MKPAEAKVTLDGFLRSMFAPFGLERVRPLIYSRQWNEAVGTLSSTFRWDARGFCAFTLGAGVRFPSFDRWLNEEGDEPRQTLATGVNGLRPGRRFMEWTFSSNSELESLYSTILGDITTYAIPFLEKYSHFEDVLRTVNSSNPYDWFNWNINSRVELFAVAQWEKGDKTAAIQLLDRALDERKNARRGQRFEIEWLRKKLLAQF